MQTEGNAIRAKSLERLDSRNHPPFLSPRTGWLCLVPKAGMSTVVDAQEHLFPGSFISRSLSSSVDIMNQPRQKVKADGSGKAYRFVQKEDQ
jgi:hypothetical protein